MVSLLCVQGVGQQIDSIDWKSLCHCKADVSIFDMCTAVDGYSIANRFMYGTIWIRYSAGIRVLVGAGGYPSIGRIIA